MSDIIKQPLQPVEKTFIQHELLDEKAKETSAQQYEVADEIDKGKPGNIKEEALKIADNGPSWYLDENIVGNGERPTYLLEKFKTVADQAKSFNELEKRFGSFKAAPENYSLEMNEERLAVDGENPFVKEFLSMAQEGNASQEFVSKTLDLISRYEEQKMPNFDKERELLGPEGEQMTNRVTKWLGKQFDQETMEWMGQRFRTAQDIQFLDKLIGKIPQVAIPSSTMQPPKRAETTEEIQREMLENNDKYLSDAIYRKSIQERIGYALNNVEM